jgi:hypothetical protein
MSEPVPRVNAASIQSAAAWPRVGLLILVAALFGAGIWMQSRVYLNHDVAWIVHSARWLLAGRRLGSDIIDVNPPLIWYFSLPAAALAQAGLLAEPAALRLWVWLVCGAALWLAHRLLAPLRDGGRALEAGAIMVGAAYAMTILAAAAFAQRDYLAFVLGLPYCLLLAWRLEARSACPRALAGLAGLLGAVGFGLKPWFLAVPLLLEGLRMAEQRTLRGALRPETLALGIGLLTYLAVALLTAPDYFRVALPLARATYWAYDSLLPLHVSGMAALEPAAYGLVLCALALSLTRHARVLLAAIGGFTLSYLGQHKGFAYHAYPALATSTVFFLQSVAHAVHQLRTRVQHARAGLKGALMVCLALLAAERCWMWSLPARQWLASYDIDEGYSGQLRRELVDTVNHYAPRGTYVYAFSTHPFPAFPTMSYTQAEWGSAFAAQFTIPAYVRRNRPAQVDARAVEQAVLLQRRYVLAEFRRYQPRVVLVETARYGRLGLRAPFDDIAFYCQDPAFAQLWREYRAVTRIGTEMVYVRTPLAAP